MLILALDTSTPVGSVALLSDETVLSRTSAEVKGRHGELLIGTIGRCLDEGEKALADVDLLVVGIGPGSFTGTRVGLATAKGLALANGLPLVGVVSLAAMARAVGAGAGFVAPLVHAHRGEVYAALYARGDAGPSEVLAPFNAPPAEAASRLRDAAGDEAIVALGDGYRRYTAELTEGLGNHEAAADNLDLPAADALGLEGRRRFLAKGPDSAAHLEPLYVRPSDAKLPAVPLKI